MSGPLAAISAWMPDFGLPLWGVMALAAVAFAANFVDAIAGGGGILTVPALLLAGLSPVSALATNKLQSTFGATASTLTFWRAGALDRGLMGPMFFIPFTASIAGAYVAHLIPATWLRAVIPFILIALAFYVLLSPALGREERVARLSWPHYLLSFGAGIGFYDGFFGPGTGTFHMLGLVMVQGFGIVRAIGHTKLMNFASNIGALLLFSLTGHIYIWLGIVMGMAAASGAWLGARTTLRFGVGLVRPLVVLVALAMALRLLLDPAHPAGEVIRGWLTI